MLLDEADVDVVLVGDSMGMVIQGYDTTVPVTMDHIVYHCRAVARGLHRPFLMADLPFMSYPSKERALENSVRLMQEGGAKMVKLESGATQAEIVEWWRVTTSRCARTWAWRPQSVHKTGGFRVQGREQDAAAEMIDAAKRLESAGADIVSLSASRDTRARRSPRRCTCRSSALVPAPTDGQILVLYDILDITTGRKPRFVRNFMQGAGDNRRGTASASSRPCAPAPIPPRALLLTAWKPLRRLRPYASTCAAGAARDGGSPSSQPWGIFIPAT